MSAKNNNKDHSPPLTDPGRRQLLRNLGVAGAALAGGASLNREAAAQDEAGGECASAAIPVREALDNLTALEADTLEAVTDRIIPSDDNGPGAREARAVHYIDRALSAHHVASREPCKAGLNALHEHAMAQHGAGFADLDSERQDAILSALESGEIDGFFQPSAPAFFEMLRSYTIEGTFSDPYYGGNRDFIGWDMIGYPGVRLGTSTDEVAQGRNLAPTHQSAYDRSTFTKNR